MRQEDRVEIRLTPKMNFELELLSKALGMSKSQLIRNLIMERIHRSKIENQGGSDVNNLQSNSIQSSSRNS